MMLTADLQAHTEPPSQFQSTHSNIQSLLAILMVDVRQELQHLQILTPELFSIFLPEVK